MDGWMENASNCPHGVIQMAKDAFLGIRHLPGSIRFPFFLIYQNALLRWKLGKLEIKVPISILFRKRMFFEFPPQAF